MNLPSRRVTLRRLMGTVALAAVMFATCSLWMRSREFKKRAVYHASQHQKLSYAFSSDAEFLEGESRELDETIVNFERNKRNLRNEYDYYIRSIKEGEKKVEDLRESQRWLARLVEHHATLFQKYKWASIHPWEINSDDPPEPQRPDQEPIPNVFYHPRP